MTEDELMEEVSEFRQGMLEERDATNWCWLMSAPLEAYLSGVCGVETRLTRGCVNSDGENGHYWLTLEDGRIIDATASQFKKPDGTPMPDVYIGPLPAWYEEVPEEKRTAGWHKMNDRRWVRSDGACVKWDANSPYPNPVNPRARMWTAWEPDPSERYIGHDVGRVRRDPNGPVRLGVPLRFKTPEAAMRRVDKLFPLKK